MLVSQALKSPVFKEFNFAVVGKEKLKISRISSSLNDQLILFTTIYLITIDLDSLFCKTLSEFIFFSW